jgi:hypothetical protein
VTGLVENILFFTALVVAPTTILFVWLRGLEYRIARHQVEVLFLGVVVRKILNQDISDVKVGLRIPCEFWANARLFRWDFVCIRRKRGFGLRYLVITPRDPERFCRNLRITLGWARESQET